ncbi:MAG: radical SAM protein [Treponema sp.]|nr:radical SAM protein [Treponema sp.]
MVSVFASKSADLNVLLVSFNFCRPDENQDPYGISCLRTAFNNSPYKLPNDRISSLVIDLNQSVFADEIIPQILCAIRESGANILAFSNFIWADRFIRLALPLVRSEFKNLLILMGGPMVSASEESLKATYPQVDFFIKSFGEEVFKNMRRHLLHNGSPFSKSASSSLIELLPSFSELDSPYLSGQIEVKKGMSVRMETRRGCLFNCAYCRHRNANCRVYQIGQMERTKKELELFSAAGVKKINVLDPFFNDINNQNMEKAKGLGFLRTCRKLNVSSEISLQIRPEMLKKEYLELASDMKNVTFEIGIQSLDPQVYPHIRRGNFRTREMVLEKLSCIQACKINSEITLIYGLPNQTYDSFARDIELLKALGFEDIKAFPLQLYPSTEIIKTYRNFGLKAKNVEPFGILQIYENPAGDFNRMEKLAEAL